VVDLAEFGFGEKERTVAGTMTFLNMPPSRNRTLKDVLSLGYVTGEHITIGEVMNSVGGPFRCFYA
jgi:tyrosinase